MPIDVKCHSCRKQYRLKDELNGKKFKCKDCGAIVTATPLKTTQPQKRSVESESSTKPQRVVRKPKSRPADRSGTDSKQRPSQVSGSRSTGKTTPQPKRKEPKHNPYADDYRNAEPDDLFRGTFEYYGDNADPYGDDAYAGAAPKRKSTKKTGKKKLPDSSWVSTRMD